MQMFQRIADVAAQYGILIMMACHRLNKDAWPGGGLWYDKVVTEARVLQSWDRVADGLCGRWNVFAVDLQNEPHASSWGKNMGSGNDWGLAAGRLGNHVLTKCARWLVMVEGVGYKPGASGMDDPAAGIWWGENLVGARHQPVKLSDMTKLVYSPHTYGPSVYMQGYFKAACRSRTRGPDPRAPLLSAPPTPTPPPPCELLCARAAPPSQQDRAFPNNMEAIWDKRFGFLPNEVGQPVVIGEMGGKYVEKDKQWQDWAASYMQRKGIGIFYFGLPPNSDDTGGLLLDDWKTPHAAKLAMLAKVPTTDVAKLAGFAPSQLVE